MSAFGPATDDPSCAGRRSLRRDRIDTGESREETEYIHRFYHRVNAVAERLESGDPPTESKLEETVEWRIEAEREKLEILAENAQYRGHYVWRELHARPAVRLAGKAEKRWSGLKPRLAARTDVDIDPEAMERARRDFDRDGFLETWYTDEEVDWEQLRKERRALLDRDVEGAVEDLVDALEECLE